MPKETYEAVEWALEQCEDYGFVIMCAKTDDSILASKVREYFNEHNIKYSTYDYYDLEPFLPEWRK